MKRRSLAHSDVREDVGESIVADVRDLSDAFSIDLPTSFEQQVDDALGVFGSYAALPVRSPRHFARLRAYLAGMRAFRNPDGYGPSFAWESPLDHCWSDGYNRAHALTAYRFDR